MYLMINGTKHTVSRRILTGDTVKYLSVTPEPVDVSGLISMYRDDGFLLCADDAAGYERTVYNGTILTLTNAPEPEPQPEPKPVWHATQAQMDASVKLASMSVTAMSLTPDETITVAALYPDWTDGTYEVGDIRLALGQPWKCRQAHDTETYPDITPDGSAWRTFWVPFHGTTPETALSWVEPTMAEDMYKSGEYMVWTDGQTYKCVSDTNFSPEDYSEAWEVVQDE